MLVVAEFCNIVRDDFLDDRLDILRWHQFMATFNDHGEDLRNLILIMRTEISHQMWIKLKKLNFVSTNHTRDESQHKQFDLVLFI
jgi:hypothetical protein